jgi:hypothetical protein
MYFDLKIAFVSSCKLLISVIVACLNFVLSTFLRDLICDIEIGSYLSLKYFDSSILVTNLP